MNDLDRAVQEALSDWCVARRHVLDRHASRAAVHEWRIATRRLLAAEALRAPSQDLRGRHGLKSRLRRAFRAAGRLRDAEVCIGLARELQSRYPLARALAGWLRRQLPRRRRRLSRRLAAVEVRGIRATVRAWLEPVRESRSTTLSPGPDPAVVNRARRRLATALRRVERSRTAAQARGAPHAMHRLRIDVKNARYIAECLATTPARRTSTPDLRALTSWQRALGAIADDAALIDAIDRFMHRHPRDVTQATALRRHVLLRQRRRAQAFLRRKAVRQ